jgi:3-oxoacyl-[acyl-carrier-protein] synthase II
MAEAKAMELIFGERYSRIPVYSMKGQIGHLIGACGAMEFLGVIYSLLYQKVPATVNFETPDPEVLLNVIKGDALDLKIKYILKLNAAFGGQNTAIVIKKYD